MYNTALWHSNPTVHYTACVYWFTFPTMAREGTNCPHVMTPTRAASSHSQNSGEKMPVLAALTAITGNVQWEIIQYTLLSHHNGCDGVSNHQPHEGLLNRLFGRRSKKTLKLRVTGLCVGNSPETGRFPAQMASNAENVSIWWRLHEYTMYHNNNNIYNIS